MPKPIESNQPDVIFTVKYATARATSRGLNYRGFLDYTQRHNATNRDHDCDLNQTPLETQRYEKFIDYTARNNATRLERQNPTSELTPTFNHDSDNLTVAATEQLRSQLDEAQANQATLWQGVISFSTKFLIENKLYDPQTEACDQGKIKAAVRKGMPALMKANGLEASGFWWGDIQFNTNHIHVHLGLSEQQPHRETYRRQDGRLIVDGVRQKLNKKSMLRFKSQVRQQVMTLGRPQTKNKRLNLEKRIGQVQAVVKKNVQSQVKPTEIEKLFAWLPADRHLWRSKSHAASMRLAQQQARKIIDSYLVTDPQYADFKQSVQQLDQYNTAAFGQKTAGRTTKQKEDQLQAQLMNALFKACREVKPADQQWSVNELAQHYQAKDIAENMARIKWLKHQQRYAPNDKQAKELRHRRVALGQQNAHALLADTTIKQARLTKMSINNNTMKMAKQGLAERYQQQQQVANLKLTKPWDLSSLEKQQLTRLQAYFTDVVNVPVNQLGNARRTQIEQRLHWEHELAADINWQQLTPEMRTALQTAFELPAQVTRQQWQARIDQEYKLLRLKAQLNAHKKEWSSEKIKKSYQEIKQQTQQLKRASGRTVKPLAKEEHQQVRPPQRPQQFLAQQRSQAKQIVAQQTHVVKKEIRQVQRAQYEDSRAKQQMFSQQAAIEHEQAVERER